MWTFHQSMCLKPLTIWNCAFLVSSGSDFNFSDSDSPQQVQLGFLFSFNPNEMNPADTGSKWENLECFIVAGKTMIVPSDVRMYFVCILFFYWPLKLNPYNSTSFISRCIVDDSFNWLRRSSDRRFNSLKYPEVTCAAIPIDSNTILTILFVARPLTDSQCSCNEPINSAWIRRLYRSCTERRLQWRLLFCASFRLWE